MEVRIDIQAPDGTPQTLIVRADDDSLHLTVYENAALQTDLSFKKGAYANVRDALWMCERNA